jgi:bifunctional DNA-binding transcriptional regulator/antitoxin component of YhaV-PrlF toxin-antitoxin module
MGACSSKVTSKGRVVIPKLLREKYAIVPTTKIRWVPTEEGILMAPEFADPIRAARGMLKGSGIINYPPRAAGGDEAGMKSS